MIRTLFVIAGSALVLSLLTGAGALAVGGRDMAAHGWNWTIPGHGDGGDVSFVRDDGTRPADVTRTLEWTGGERLEIDLSHDVEYVQGDTPGVTITGPADRIAAIRLDGDRLTEDRPDGPRNEQIVFGRRENGRGVWIRSDDITIRVVAPAVSRFVVNGSSDLSIRAYDRPDLTLEMTGSGDVTASGATGSLRLTGHGSGDADLDNLSVKDAEVELTGSGDAHIAPTATADLTLTGSGDIDLSTRPASVRQNVTGSGGVNQD